MRIFCTELLRLTWIYLLLTKQVYELLLFAIGFVAGFAIKQILERRIVGFLHEVPARRHPLPVKHDEQQKEENLSFPVQVSVEEREAIPRYTLRSEDLIFVLRALQSIDGCAEDIWFGFKSTK